MYSEKPDSDAIKKPVKRPAPEYVISYRCGVNPHQREKAQQKLAELLASFFLIPRAA